MWVYGLDRAASGQGQMAGTCDCGHELSGSIKCGEFDWLRTGQLLKKDSAPWSKLGEIIPVAASSNNRALISPQPDQEGNKLQRPNSNFCKPLKKNSEGCPSNQVSAATMTSASDEKWRPFNCFFSRVGLRTYQHPCTVLLVYLV